MENNSLTNHGILSQKWGVRRYQNKKVPGFSDVKNLKYKEVVNYALNDEVGTDLVLDLNTDII